MSTARVSARYTTPCGAHEVLITRDAAGRWQVIDAGGPQILLVETLTGHDDRLDQADALARDYADQQQAYHDGHRKQDPLPRPARVDIVLDAA